MHQLDVNPSTCSDRKPDDEGYGDWFVRMLSEGQIEMHRRGLNHLYHMLLSAGIEMPHEWPEYMSGWDPYWARSLTVSTDDLSPELQAKIALCKKNSKVGAT